MVLLGLSGFVCALACGWALSALLTAEDAKNTVKTAIGGGALPLLHAQEEAELARRDLATNLDKEAATLKSALDGLKGKLTVITKKMQEAQKKLTDLMVNAGDEEARKKSLLAEKKRLDQLLAAFKTADDERQKAEKAEMEAALPQEPGGLTPKSLDEWKKEWQDIVVGADKQISAARKSLGELQKKQAEWESGQDTFLPDKKKDMHSQLSTLLKTAQSSLKAAREAVYKSELPLKEKMATQSRLIDKALESAAKK